MKKLALILTFLALVSCQSFGQKELEKSTRHKSASDRINQTNQNSDDLSKELD
jgi:hypothetical protein